MKYTLRLLPCILLLVVLFSCQKELSEEQGRPGISSLWDAAGDCLPMTVNGIYAAGTSLTADNYIDVTVDVRQAGRYNISTNTVNGYSFAASGSFSTIGSHTVRLKGTGTPVAEGDNLFTVALDSTYCDVTVTVGTGTVPGTGGNYFPLTTNSWWSYEDPEGIDDSIKIVNTGEVSLGGKTYSRFITYDDTNAPFDTAHYRLETGTYYKVMDLNDEFYGIATFTSPLVDVPFMKQVITGSSSWNTTTFTGNISGMTATFRISYAAAVLPTLSLGGKNFTNVYEIVEKLQVQSPTGWMDMVTTGTSYYAKDVGLINFKQAMVADQSIRMWAVL